MLTATFDSPEMAQFVADIIRPYGVKQPKVNGSTMTIDDQAIEILADIDDQTDGHYDGEAIWIGGTEYPVTQVGRTRKGDQISLRIPAEDLAAGAELASTLGIDRTELFRHYIHTGLAQGADPFRYTAEIQASTPDGNVWQALHPAETVFAKPGETAQDIAEWVAGNQTIADGGNWRVVVWRGEDMGAEPTHIETHTSETKSRA